MRSLLILAGLLVAGIVAFAVAWPRLVDAEALRIELVRLLRTAGGTELEFQGAVRLELLPLPRVSIERVVLGDRTATTAGTRFEADRIDVEIAPLALLAGRLEPRRLQLVRPRLALVALPATFAAQALRALDSGDLAGVRRVDVIDGAAVLPLAEGTAWPRSIEAMDLAATREGATGFRVEGTAAVAGESLRLELRGEPLQLGAPMALNLTLASGPREAPATLDLQGNLRPEADGPRLAGRLRVATLKAPPPSWLARALGVEQALPPVDLLADLTLATGSLRLDDLELDLAGGRLRGAFSMALGAERSFDLSLEGTELVATPELARSLRDLAPAMTAAPGLTGRVGLRLATIGWREGQIRRLRAELAVAPGGRLDLRHLEATLPGDTAVAWEGTGPAAGDALLIGSLAVQAGELRALLVWLGLDPADLPSGGLTSLDLTTAATLGTDRLTLRDLSGRLDASQLRGTVAFATAARPRLDLAVTLDRVNMALYAPEPPGPAARQLWRERLAALDGTLDLAVERLTYDALRGRDLRLRLALQDGRVAVDELRVGDLGEASLQASGAVDLGDDSYDLAGAVEVAQPKPILRLLRLEPPPELQRLAPLRLSGKVKGGGAGAGIDVRLEARGAAASLAGTLGPPGGSGVALVARVTAADTADLLVALGWPAPTDRPALGSLDFGVEIRRGDGPYDLSMRGTIGASDLSGQAKIDTSGPRRRLDGQLSAALLDTTLLAALYDTAALPLGFAPGRPWLWPGVWPPRPLEWQWLDALDLDLTVDVAQLRHRGHDLPGIAGRAALDSGQLALSGLALPLAGGIVSGTVTLEHADGYAVLGTDLQLTHGRAEGLVAALAPGSELAGEVDLAAELVGQGRSMADLVGTLRGTGELTLRGGRLPGLALGSADLGMSGPFSVADGVLTSSVLALPDGAASVRLRLDLLAWILDTVIHAAGAEQRFLGPPGRLQAIAP